jgi:hypothetical protein
MYNERGGYTLHRVWERSEEPGSESCRVSAHTVAIKLLFTQATEDQVPYLKGTKEWEAYIYSETLIPTNPLLPRTKQKVRLLQIDVAVKDSRSETTGWVFGTFVYNSERSGASVWERFEPVGLMWGNDPKLSVAAARKGGTVKEGWINPDPKVPYQHLGWAGRLNGPVE